MNAQARCPRKSQLVVRDILDTRKLTFVTISKRTVRFFMSDCIYDTQLALIELRLLPGVLLGLRPTWPGVMTYQRRRGPAVGLTGKLEVLNKVAVSTHFRGKALCKASGR